MASFIPNYIHKYQVGFIPGRQGPDQIRRAIDIISILHSQWDGGSPQKGFVLSIDLHKTFDSVSWPYVFEILERWGFGPNFRGIVISFFSTPSAQVRLMGKYSDSLAIRKGTRQGCVPIAMETLAIAIRSHLHVKGILYGAQEHKCALFSDYLLLFVTSPLTSTPN